MEVLAPNVLGRKILPWSELKILPIGDIQYTGRNGASDIDRLEKHIKWGIAQDAIFVGMGDFSDFLSPSNKLRLRQAGLYDTAEEVIDQAAITIEKELMEVLRPTIGRWLGFIEGHHSYTSLDGTTTGQRFSRFLQCPYLGDSAILRITFRDEQNHGVNLKMFVHHGHGGGSTYGGILNRLERFAARFPDIQLIMTGHHHQVIVQPMDSLDVTDRGEPYLFHKTRMLVCTGSFMKGWMQGHNIGGRPQGLYPEQKMMPPTALGAPLIIAHPKRIQSHGADLSIIDLRGSV